MVRKLQSTIKCLVMMVCNLSTVLGNIATVGTTLEGLGTLGYTDIDVLPASLDARLWVGGKFLFAGAKDTKIITFTGNDKDNKLSKFVQKQLDKTSTFIDNQVDE